MNRMDQYRLKFLLAIVILCSCVGCDQVTKNIAIQQLRDAPPKSYLAGTVRLEFAQNPVGFLSLGANLPEGIRTSLFVAMNSCMMLALLCFIYIKRNISLLLFVSLVLILSGGIGNLIDRVFNNGLVTDFINVGIGPLRTGVFNVADMAVLFGAIAAGCLTIKREADEPSDARAY